MKRALFLLLCMGLGSGAFADEGMWLPIHVERLNYVDMDRMGLQLTADEIYSVNNSSLKDAIVNLGGGFCTGEIISDAGLMLTNHHCGYSFIQRHSSVENDILTNGFWAMTREDELPNDGLFVQFLVRMEDVSKVVLKDVKEKMTETERAFIVESAIEKITKEAKGNTHYDVVVKPFYEGNEYYLFVYETFHDVRLVGAPPESIGKFGGDTDNWMWPRHTGDFALFRVYSAPDGKPAKYSPDNIPLKPKHHLPVSLDGVQENDFAMVFGYPGTTNRYLTSFGVKLAIEKTNPARVKIRGKKLEIMKKYMDQDAATRLAYASKYASVSNYWKYFIGQTNGLKRLGIYDEKVAIETELTGWIQSKKSRGVKYGDPVAEIASVYGQIEEYTLPFYYYLEAGFGIEFVREFSRIGSLAKALKTEDNKENVALQIERIRESSQKFFKDYKPEIDEEVFAEMAAFFLNDMKPEYVPEIFAVLNKSAEEQKSFLKDESLAGGLGTISLARYIFENSILMNKSKLNAFLNEPSAEILVNDPGYLTVTSIADAYRNMSEKRGSAIKSLEVGRRNFIAALREMKKNTKYYPDANSTMRLTYGKVMSYQARDAVHYHYLTTLEGVMEKEDAENPEFNVHSRLKELHTKRDYGKYSDDGRLYVGFITNNDITGGNSGSPVINARGHLIGTAFDGNWEAMSGDIAFEPELQRCISVDIRYVLFIIDKFAGAGHLVDEMTIIRNGVVQTRK